MKYLEFPILIAFFIFTCRHEAKAKIETIKFNDNWQFKFDTANTPDEEGLATAQWSNVQLPHDWSIELNFDETSPGASLRGGTGLYRKYFTLDNSDQGKNIFIDFDGVYMSSTVWINGQKLGTRPFGYISFRYDLTPYLKFGGQKNELLVRAENRQPNSRWYSRSGIYRNIWISKKGSVFVDQWGTYITAPQVSNQSAAVKVQTKIRNSLNDNITPVLKTLIYDNKVDLFKTLTTTCSVAGNSMTTVEQEVVIQNPQLWSTENRHFVKR